MFSTYETTFKPNVLKMVFIRFRHASSADFHAGRMKKIARPTCKRIYRNQSILLLYILGMSTCAPLQSIVDIIRLAIHLSSKIVSVNAYPPVPLLTEIHRSVVSRLLFHFVFVIFHVMCISKQQSRAAPANVYLSLITP